MKRKQRRYQIIATEENATFKKAYDDIVEELKVLFKGFPIQFKTYVQVQVPSTESDTYTFATPLVNIQLFEGYGQYYLSFARDMKHKDYVSTDSWNNILRCIMKHTSAENTLINIEDYITEAEHFVQLYGSFVKLYNEGDLKYKPFGI